MKKQQNEIQIVSREVVRSPNGIRTMMKFVVDTPKGRVTLTTEYNGDETRCERDLEERLVEWMKTA